MGILARPLAAAPAWDDRWYEGSGAMSRAGVQVTMDTALTIPAFYAGVAYVSEDIAKVPLKIYEDLGEDKGHREAPEHYLYEKLDKEPSEYQTSLEFREMMTAFAMLRGRAIAEIRTAGRPLVDDEYYPLHPDLVREEQVAGGRRRYMYRDPRKNFTERPLLPDQVVVLRGRLGKSLIDVLRDTIGLAQAQERHAANLFARGAKPGGVVMRDKGWSDTERRNFRRGLNEYASGGDRSGRPLLLEDGMTWKDVGMTNADAEALDSRRFSTIQFCQGIRIPPHKLFELERSTNNNIERQSIDYVTDSLLGWGRRWELVIRRDLIIVRDRLRGIFAEHNLDGLMRGDFKARSEGYASAVNTGWMAPDEVRKKENLNPMGGAAGDLRQPLNQGPVGGPGGGASQARAVANGRAKLLAASASSRLVRREMSGVEKLLERTDPGGLPAALQEFYAEHADQVARQLHVGEHEALAYARDHREAILAGGPTAMAEWLVDGAETLTNLAMDLQEAAA
jgi:HK97 family phage portal protein